MFVGVLRLVLSIPGARSLKDRRQVVKSFKERVRARLGVSVAEVGDVELLQVATLGACVVSRQSEHCREVLEKVRGLAARLSDAIVADVASEVLSFGDGGTELRGGIENVLDSCIGEFGAGAELSPETFEAPPISARQRGRK
ncbi:MAG TPA: DUF503 family protein [Polyangiaceae bacterium]|nr:DUF503 family protein [Polyangiaceae bacterium]